MARPPPSRPPSPATEARSKQTPRGQLRVSFDLKSSATVIFLGLTGGSEWGQIAQLPGKLLSFM